MSHTLFAALEDWSLEDEISSNPLSSDEEAKTTEIEEAAEEGKQQAEQVDQVAEDVDTAQMLMQHISTYGIDRTTMFFYNSHNELSNALQLALPSYESFPAVGNPYSQESIAMMEGLGSGIKKAYEWIKKKLVAIYNFIKKTFKAISDWFSSKEKDTAKVKAKAAAADKKIATSPEAREAVKEVVQEKVINPIKVNDLIKQINAADEQISKKDSSGYSTDRAADVNRKYAQKIKDWADKNLTDANVNDVLKAGFLSKLASAHEIILQKVNALGRKRDQYEKAIAGFNKQISQNESLDIKASIQNAGSNDQDPDTLPSADATPSPSPYVQSLMNSVKHLTDSVGAMIALSKLLVSVDNRVTSLINRISAVVNKDKIRANVDANRSANKVESGFKKAFA